MNNKEQDASTQFLVTQKEQPIDFQEHLQSCSNVLSVSGLNSANLDKNSIQKTRYLSLLKNDMLNQKRTKKLISLHHLGSEVFSCYL